MNTVQWVLAGFVAVAALFKLTMLATTLAFVNRRRAAPDGRPPITILKPVRGAEPEAFDNFASFAAQDYPDFEIIFGVADKSDPAVPVIHRLIEAYPHREIRLVVAPQRLSVNQKVSTLRQMLPEARHAVLVVSDSDVSAAPDLLARLADALDDPKVGVVSTLYRFTNLRGPAGAIRAITVHTDFLPQAILGRALIGPSILLGATYAIKREALGKVGSFEALGDMLADDYVMGDLVRRAGYRAEIVPDSVNLPDSGEIFSQWLRWVRTYRVCRPGGWFMSILTQVTPWSVALAAASGGAALPLSIAGAGLAVRWISALTIDAVAFGGGLLRYAWLIPIRDVAAAAMWAASFLGNRVTWRGTDFRVNPDGRLEPLTPEPELVARALTPAEEER